MQYIEFGKTGLKVSRLCFGALVMGPLQANLSVDKGSEIIAEALKCGINFIDTAELYGTYAHIREAIRKTGIRPVIATKSYAYSAEQAAASFEKALRELDTDYIDIFMLHEQESRLTLRGHRDALEYYIRQKELGRLKAVGVSTHNIEVVEACSDMPGIDVIHPLINRTGIGIGDGSIEAMLKAVRKAHSNGKGIYSMKALGGGTLISSYFESINFVLGLPYIDSVAMGMQSTEEVAANVAMFEKGEIPEELQKLIEKKNRKLHIDYWCEGCGRCVSRCRQSALSISGGKALVDRNLCVLCGYCASVCPQFAIKIF